MYLCWWKVDVTEGVHSVVTVATSQASVSSSHDVTPSADKKKTSQHITTYSKLLSNCIGCRFVLAVWLSIAAVVKVTETTMLLRVSIRVNVIR